MDQHVRPPILTSLPNILTYGRIAAVPVLAALHINPIWYGILLTINLELALITPPVGMNLFAIKAITRAPIGEIILGVTPYVVLLIAGLGLVLAFPQIALWLPGTMNYK